MEQLSQQGMAENCTQYNYVCGTGNMECCSNSEEIQMF